MEWLFYKQFFWWSKHFQTNMQIKMTFGKNGWKAISFPPLTSIDGEIEVWELRWPHGRQPSLSVALSELHARPLLSWLEMHLPTYFFVQREEYIQQILFLGSAPLSFSANLRKCKPFIVSTTGWRWQGTWLHGTVTRVLRWQQKEALKCLPETRWDVLSRIIAKTLFEHLGVFVCVSLSHMLLSLSCHCLAALALWEPHCFFLRTQNPKPQSLLASTDWPQTAFKRCFNQCFLPCSESKYYAARRKQTAVIGIKGKCTASLHFNKTART